MKILFTGDSFISDAISYVELNENVKRIFDACKYRVSCCEAPYCSSNIEPCRKVGPHLRQGSFFPGYAPLFTHFSLANNHSMDYGRQGLKETAAFMNRNGMVGMGASESYPDMYEPTIIEDGEVSVALFCWAEAQYGCCKSDENGCGYAWLMNPITYRLIQEHKSRNEFVVLYLHAGLEDEDIPLADWRRQYQSYIDYGADLVIASHPHVIQGKEIYKGKSIYYSLGNFYFSGEYLPEASKYHESLLLECEFLKNEIKVSEHFSLFEGTTISLAGSEVALRFYRLSEVLSVDTEYSHLYDDMVLKCWNEYYKESYSFPIFKNKGKVVFYRQWFNKLMSDYVKRCFLPPISYNQIYHNISIDTHRYVVSRACQLLEDTY